MTTAIFLLAERGLLIGDLRCGCGVLRKNRLAGDVVGNEDAKSGECGGEIARLDSAVQCSQQGLKLIAWGQRRIKGDEASRGRRMRRFAVRPELFGFLVTGAEMREFDGAFAIWSKCAAHEARQVCNEMRLRQERGQEGRRLRFNSR